ncbi:hypothetical protein [Phenylobacterium sp.]|uniref:hypothetical protein n=1 Tax=Phenylobacterium sp. TaxID=1871053 RepID=UPI0025E62186|nr:hypothetical protein [Phenylobacterium sp.]
MSEPFSAKLALTLKALSLSRGRLAADLEVDKSVVGRWVTGAAAPSGHNLSRLTGLIAARIEGFTALDWDRGLADFAERLGADPGSVPGLSAAGVMVQGLPLPLLDQMRATTALRGPSYEGFFRSTRPYQQQPGRFLHDHGMLRLDAQGLLALRMGTGGQAVEGWMLPLQNQLFCVATDLTSGALIFGIFNGVPAAKAQVVDGLILGAALDPGRTPTASVMVFERIGELSGDVAADDARFAALAASNPVAPEGSVPEALAAHLVPETGPSQLALGGDWLLRMPLARSLARGPAYGEDG